MPIYRINNKDILFVHIPKTGGTSIHAWLSRFGESTLWSPTPDVALNGLSLPRPLPCTPQHLMYSYIVEHLAGHRFDYVFSIVRDPLDRMISEYKFLKMKERDHGIRCCEPFDEWVEGLGHRISSDRWSGDNHWRPQHEFLDPLVETFRFEDSMERIASAIGEKIGIDITQLQVPREMHGDDFADCVTVTERSVSIIEDVYASDYERLGYGRNSLRPAVSGWRQLARQRG